jgi:hypothetical protein
MTSKPLGTLTTYELRDRKQQLDCTLSDTKLDHPTRTALLDQLGAVIAEQEERKRQPRGPGAGREA